MPVKIRLMRIGAKKRPFYRVVAVDERNKRNGEYLELLGTYNPLTEPKEINLKQSRIDDWTKKGAVMSDGFLRIIGQAPQRPARKPKKDKGPASSEAQVKPDQAASETETSEPEQPADVQAEEASEQTQVEQTPAEESQPEEKPETSAEPENQ